MFLDFCHICKKPLFFGYLYDIWGNKICESHINNDAVHCDSCSAFTRKENVLSDGRVLCKSCFCASVKPGDSIEKVGKFVIYKLFEVGFNDLLIENISIEVVSALRLAEIRNSNVCLQIKGFTLSSVHKYNILGVFTNQNFKHKIFMLSHLTNTEFIGTLAHEMLHAWLVQNSVEMTLKMKEGFCNLGTYLMYTSTVGPLAKIHLKSLHENSDPIYGDGFREMYQLYKSLGWNELIKSVKKTN